MSAFQRKGHWRTSKYGTTHWVESHSVSRNTWDKDSSCFLSTNNMSTLPNKPNTESIKCFVNDVFAGCSVNEINRFVLEGTRLCDSGEDDFYFSIVDRLIRNIISDNFSFWLKRYETYINNRNYYSDKKLDRLFHWHITDRMNIVLLDLEVKHSLNLAECFRIIKSTRYVDAINRIAIDYVRELLENR